MACTEAVLRLVSLAYDAVSAPDGWGPFLRQLAMETGATLAALLAACPGSGSYVEVCSARHPDAPSNVVDARWPSARTPATAAEPCVVAELDANRAESMVLVPLCGSCQKGCTIGLAGMAGTFTRDASDLVLALVPYLRHVVTLRARVLSNDSLRNAAITALDRLSYGVAFLGAGGVVLLANDVAAQMFERSGVVRLEKGRLALTDPREDARLQQLVRRVGSRGTDEQDVPLGFAFGTEDGRGILLQLCPFNAGVELFGHGDEPQLVAFLVEPQRAPAIDERTLARVFGLTNSEARLAARLAGGRSVKEIAREASITVPTVRTHLHHVFSKTGASRQADLVRLLVVGFGKRD